MTARELIDFIFSKLDEKILNNLYFQELKKIVYKNCQNDFLVINVDPDIYEQLPPNDFPVEVGSSILEFKSGHIYFNITSVDVRFLVELRFEDDKSIKNTLITISDLSRIEASSILIENGKYVSFDTNVYYYINNKMMPITVLGEDDVNFAYEFHLPFRLAHFFRINFKKFGIYFSKCKEMGKFTEIGPFLEEKDYYAFIGTFKINSFLGFIKGYTFVNIDSSLLEVLIENGKFNDIEPEREATLNSLITFIGNQGEGVITYSLYQEILLYLTGCVSSLNARGFLLQKINNLFILYFITYNNNELNIEAQELTYEEAQSMYEQNEFNKENNSLSSFFDINLAR